MNFAVGFFQSLGRRCAVNLRLKCHRGLRPPLSVTKSSHRLPSAINMKSPSPYLPILASYNSCKAHSLIKFHRLGVTKVPWSHPHSLTLSATEKAAMKSVCLRKWSSCPVCVWAWAVGTKFSVNSDGHLIHLKIPSTFLGALFLMITKMWLDWKDAQLHCKLSRLQSDSGMDNNVITQ